MKKVFLINIGLLLLAILLDQLTKSSADSFFSIVQNKGLLLNMLEDLPLRVKAVALGTTAGILFFFYLTLLYLMNQKHTNLRYALSFLMAGILSNTFDKLSLGHTIDFLPFGPYAFNVADVFTLGGIAYVFQFLFKNHNDLWPVVERRSIFINPRAQIIFGLKYSVVSMCTSLLLGILAFTFIKTYVFPSILTTSENLLPTFVVLHVTLTFLFSAVVFVIGIVVSHRFVGPIAALEIFVDKLDQGIDARLTLRQSDYFKQLENVGHKISKFKKESQD